MGISSCSSAAFSKRRAFVAAVAAGCCLLAAGCSSFSTTNPTTSRPGRTTSTSTSSTSTSTSTTTTLPGLTQPTAAHPITILDIGDSLGEDLGLGLGYTLGANPIVRVIQDAGGDTGLARPDYYNWPLHLAQELAEYHPQVVTILIGGNDSQNFLVNGKSVVFGTPEWHTIYSQRVALMMTETLNAGAKMVWVGMPIMQNAASAASMQTLNAIYQAQAALHPGVEFLPTWALFSNSAGQFTFYLTNSSGQKVLARDDDGIHIAPPGGCDIVAVAAIKEIESVWRVRLGI